MVALSIKSGIPFETWIDGDERALETALDLMHEEAKELERHARRR